MGGDDAVLQEVEKKEGGWRVLGHYRSCFLLRFS